MPISYMPPDALSEEPLSDILTAAAAIDAIDIELALGRLSGKQSILEDCIEQTANSIDEKLGRMYSLLSDSELRDFSIEAHGLKNALAEIGAMEYSSLASELELASKLGNSMLCDDKFPAFSSLTRDLAVKLKAIFPQKRMKNKPSGGDALFSRLVCETIGFLGDFEADDALACLSKLDEVTFGEEADALLNHVRSVIKAYKYDEAVNLLQSISC